jgi:predicted ATPase
MKLTKLYIHNYKSFYDTTIELDKLNIVVGENNSGKSNLIDVLEFIQLAKNTSFYIAISQKGGFNKVWNYHYNEKNIFFELEFQDNIFLIKTRFTINPNFSVVSLIIYAKSNDGSLIPLHINASRKNRDKNSMKEKMYSYEENILKLNLTDELFILQLEFPNMLSSFSSIYYFNAQKIKDKSNQYNDNKELLNDGSNLGKILFNIKEKDINKFEVISNSLITTVNEIDAIEVQEVLGSYPIGFKEKEKEAVPIHIVSDGTINFLSTITALYQSTKSFLLAFEEPERHLHLKVMDYLLESFRESDKQIIVTTHSSELLNYAKLDEIVFIYRDSDGDTQSIRAIDIPNLEGKMERLAYERPMSLDEMIYCGIVGDFE